jgi:hypothetical protein
MPLASTVDAPRDKGLYGREPVGKYWPFMNKIREQLSEPVAL